MANGYYQIKMEGENWDKTAFVTKYGQFVFTRVPFSLSNAPGTFCRALGRGFEDHMKKMQQVLSRFRDFKLKLKPSKCELLNKERHNFLNPGMVKEVNEWPMSRNKADLESFLGLMHFYREHLDRFADTAACLYRLTRAEVKFVWGEEEELISEVKGS